VTERMYAYIYTYKTLAIDGIEVLFGFIFY